MYASLTGAKDAERRNFAERWPERYSKSGNFGSDRDRARPSQARGKPDTILLDDPQLASGTTSRKRERQPPHDSERAWLVLAPQPEHDQACVLIRRVAKDSSQPASASNPATRKTWAASEGRFSSVLNLTWSSRAEGPLLPLKPTRPRTPMLRSSMPADNPEPIRRRVDPLRGRLSPTRGNSTSNGSGRGRASVDSVRCRRGSIHEVHRIPAVGRARFRPD